MNTSQNSKPDFESTQAAFQLKSTADLKKAQALFTILGYPVLTKMAKPVTQFLLDIHFPIAPVLRSTVFKQFCGGETMEECTTKVNELYQEGQVCSILDYSVENKEGEAQFDDTLNILLMMCDYSENNRATPFLVFKSTGLGRFDLFVKISQGEKLTGAEAAEWDRVTRRFDILCFEASKTRHIKVMVDAEESWIQAAVDELVDSLMQRYNTTRTVVFNTVQLYRKDRLPYLRKLQKEASQGDFTVGLKLVRGAYMEKERNRAAELGYDSPICVDKQATDANFDSGMRFCMEHLDVFEIFIGTHNEASTQLALKWMQEAEIPPQHSKIWFGQLYGMSDNITFNLAQEGYNTAKYLPFGPVKDVIPYLLRRAEENTSVGSQTSRELFLIKKELKRRKLAKES